MFRSKQPTTEEQTTAAYVAEARHREKLRAYDLAQEASQREWDQMIWERRAKCPDRSHRSCFGH